MVNREYSGVDPSGSEPDYELAPKKRFIPKFPGSSPYNKHVIKVHLQPYTLDAINTNH